MLLAGKFIHHEESQNANIAALQAQLELHIAKEDAGKSDPLVYTDDGYNYLAIGNSITEHPINEYWWNEVGMAATELEKDYVHLVASGIEKKLSEDRGKIETDGKKECSSVNLEVLNMHIWEIQATDRAETYIVLDPYLSPKLDLVTIQLGENVTNTDTLEADFEELIRYIKKRCPNARILIIGDFWKDTLKDELKKEASIACDATYINLEDIQDKKEYQAGMGTVVYDAEGNEHVIEHEGVAAHPGDRGMEEIAERILRNL